jgi:hypothetical protein
MNAVKADVCFYAISIVVCRLVLPCALLVGGAEVHILSCMKGNVSAPACQPQLRGTAASRAIMLSILPDDETLDMAMPLSSSTIVCAHVSLSCVHVFMCSCVHVFICPFVCVYVCISLSTVHLIIDLFEAGRKAFGTLASPFMRKTYAYFLYLIWHFQLQNIQFIL